MRICFLSAGTFAHVGPYLDWFHRAGHEVHFVALSPSPPRAVPVHAFGRGTGKWEYPLTMLRARHVIKKLNPDVVHAHYATSGGLASLVCGRRPVVVTAHGTDLTAGARSPVWRPLLRAIFGSADCVNTVSDDLKEMAVELGIPQDKIEVLTPGVDLARFHPGSRPRLGPVRILCARRLEPTYDPLTVVRGLRALKSKGVEFRMTFAGAGPLRADTEALMGNLGLAAETEFVGEVPHSAMPVLLREHDVYLSASLWDGTSLSLLEAMATGLFPVVSRIKANEAWLEDGVSGVLHAPGDAEGLAAGVLRCVREPALAWAAAAANRARVAARADRAANMARLEELYRKLVAGKR